MIIRIVKLTFRPDSITDFKEVFNREKHHIANFDGCSKLDLLRDKENPNVFFTYSEWRDAYALERYRNSDTFNRIWGKAKLHFAGKPEAWSVEQVA